MSNPSVWRVTHAFRLGSTGDRFHRGDLVEDTFTAEDIEKLTHLSYIELVEPEEAEEAPEVIPENVPTTDDEEEGTNTKEEEKAPAEGVTIADVKPRRGRPRKKVTE